MSYSRLVTASAKSGRYTAKWNHSIATQICQLSTSNSNEKKNFSTSEKDAQPKGMLNKLFGPESCVASPTFTNRWLMVIPAFTTQMCLGAPYAWSLMADVCTREIGIVAPAAADWSLLETAFPLSLVFVMHGLSASLLGKWQMKVGPRASMAAASVAFGGGIMAGAAGIYFHSIPLLYGGYGILGGLGIGLAYTPPIQTLISWFPDKKGLASGIVVAGFGSGALFFTPTVQYLMKHFAQVPDYLGPAGSTVTQIVDGKMFASLDGKLIEVVQAGAAELAKLPPGFSEGLYAVGTGSTGAAEALAVMGAGYMAVILASSLAMKTPHPSYVPAGMVKAAGSSAPAAVVVADVSVDDAMKTPQFYLLGTTFFCVATGGMGLLSVAKPMMSEVFSAILPAVVTSAFASKFLLMLSAGNLGNSPSPSPSL
jgi:MFS family permease